MENDITLTEREKTIIACLQAGKITDEEVASALGISISTVSCFMQQLYSKFCIENGQLRAKLVWKVMSWFVYVVQQIVKLCNDALKQETDTLNSSEKSLAKKILDLLKTEEVNEDNC